MTERPQHVLMFGWEYPPHFTGGLGIACRGLVGGLLSKGARVTLVLPHDTREAQEGLTCLDASDLLAEGRVSEAPLLDVRTVPSPLRPYANEELAFFGPSQPPSPRDVRLQGGYGTNLREEVLRFAESARAVASRQPFDVIHAHDWMTFPAAQAARRLSGKPLVVHVHSTEFDRGGGDGNAWISGIEGAGIQASERVICVSRYTADIVRRRYGVTDEKLRVVHNAIAPASDHTERQILSGEPLVLFAGRLTSQKGPEYFVEAARMVLAARPDVRFVLAGDGEMKPRLMRRVAQANLGDRILFTGFVAPEILTRLYRKADVYVLPSVSEPFGLTVLESLQSGTPVILSRRSGVSEVVRHALRVDFWNTREVAGKILSLLKFAPLRREMSSRGRVEVERMSWESAAAACLEIYEEAANLLAPSAFSERDR